MKNQAGFTLIEVMGAMVVFTGGVLMMLNLAESLSRQVNRSALISELSGVVREQVDSLYSVGFDGLTVAETTANVQLRPNLTWTLTRTITSYSPLVKQITVSMEPRGFTGPSRSYSTWIADQW